MAKKDQVAWCDRRSSKDLARVPPDIRRRICAAIAEHPFVADARVDHTGKLSFKIKENRPSGITEANALLTVHSEIKLGLERLTSQIPQHQLRRRQERRNSLRSRMARLKALPDPVVEPIDNRSLFEKINDRYAQQVAA